MYNNKAIRDKINTNNQYQTLIGEVMPQMETGVDECLEWVEAEMMSLKPHSPLLVGYENDDNN